MGTEFLFMVQQLQLELQQDIKTTQQIFQKELEQLTAEVTKGNIKMNKLDKKITELQLEMNSLKTIKVDIERQSESSSTTPPNIPAAPVVSPAHLLIPAIKSDHLTLKRSSFPVYQSGLWGQYDPKIESIIVEKIYIFNNTNNISFFLLTPQLCINDVFWEI